MTMRGLGHVLFAFSMVGIGVLNFLYVDFALQWQPVPTGLPGREVLAYAWGSLLLIGGLGLLLKRTAAPAAFLLTVNLLIWALLPIPQAALAPFGGGAWLGVCEDLAMTCGCWILCVSLVARGDKLNLSFVAGDNGMRVARFLFSASCLVFCLSHFAYADFTAGMIPAWHPGRLWLAYLTGAGQFAAGLGILAAIVPRLAATLEALMMSSFVLLVHVPSIVVKPAPSWASTSRAQWTMLFIIASTLAAAAWMVAWSLRGLPWGLGQKEAATTQS